MSTAARVRGWLDSFDIDCARRARQLAEAGAAEPPESLFGNAGKRSNQDAAGIGSRTDALDEFGGAAGPTDPDSDTDTPGPGPGAGEADSFERALRDGRVSTGHIDALILHESWRPNGDPDTIDGRNDALAGGDA